MFVTNNVSLNFLLSLDLVIAVCLSVYACVLTDLSLCSNSHLRKRISQSSWLDYVCVDAGVV